MKKMPSLFKRDYEKTRKVYSEVVPGSEWVLDGEGVPTIKYDGTSCMVRGGKLYKRYDRKKKGDSYKPAPKGWEPCEKTPNEQTGHWPGWVPVDESNPNDKWHCSVVIPQADGTYELVGPKVQSNPYQLDQHELWCHGAEIILENPRTFQEIEEFLKTASIEGIVWHHEDGRRVKIKAGDFGFDWKTVENLDSKNFDGVK